MGLTANSQEIQRPKSPETKEAALDKEAADAEVLGQTELDRRFEKVISKMTAIYRERMAEKPPIMTREDLLALSNKTDTPKWKQTAARKALGIEEEGGNL